MGVSYGRFVLFISEGVTEGSHHGRIEHSRIPGVPIPSFTRAKAEQGYIFYVHDGSETVADHFTVVTNITDIRKQSLPFVVYVKITAIIDDPPIVTVNRILKVWEGSVTEITTVDLSSEDPDSPPESLEFIITKPGNGHLALKSAPSRPVMNFTQEHIHHGQLVFVHKGALSGRYHFPVNDGVTIQHNDAAKSLVFIKNQELKVFPGSSKLITEDELLITTNDFDDIYGNHTITYNVTSPPRFGSLMWKQDEDSTEEISSFTQNMVFMKSASAFSWPMLKCVLLFKSMFTWICYLIPEKNWCGIGALLKQTKMFSHRCHPA
ncbi:chondroitin sulfate proteoglycan 4-like [Carassius carassius]|uniref:chondroitin sulfate proteoglycan 4-like n=1 Tax=Carassius carassius TaxID=217509 RepID=UPI002869505B|nr:chondroitin sulfate proteoglycan 4-like [Carassius carassius]